MLHAVRPPLLARLRAAKASRRSSLLCLTACVFAASLASTPARADLKLCNTTSSRVGVAIGYRDVQGWASEGWWNVASHTCETLLKGVLIALQFRHKAEEGKLVSGD